MNCTRTHFKLQYEKYNYIFTPTFGSCTICNDLILNENHNKNQLIPIIQTGKISLSPKPSEYENWISCCNIHFENIASKKQHCNSCNKKAIVKDEPKLCINCITLLTDNYLGMVKTCKFPDKSRIECNCLYCKKC